jgi:hypothetical protein
MSTIQRPGGATAGVQLVGDLSKVEVPGLSAEEIHAAVSAFQGMDRASAAAEIRLQKETFEMLGALDDTQGAKVARAVGADWPALKSAIGDSLKEIEALARHVETEGKLPVDEYGKLMHSTGVAVGLVFAAES